MDRTNSAKRSGGDRLAACDGCTMYVEQMRRTIELTGTLSVDDVTPKAEEALLRAFRDWKGQ